MEWIGEAEKAKPPALNPNPSKGSALICVVYKGDRPSLLSQLQHPTENDTGDIFCVTCILNPGKAVRTVLGDDSNGINPDNERWGNVKLLEVCLGRARCRKARDTANFPQ